jgi:antitoxin HicB
LRNAEDAVKSWVETAKEFGDLVPEPAQEGAKGKFLQRIPKTMHAKLMRQAKVEGVSLNTLVVALIAEGLGARRAR